MLVFNKKTKEVHLIEKTEKSKNYLEPILLPPSHITPHLLSFNAWCERYHVYIDRISQRFFEGMDKMKLEEFDLRYNYEAINDLLCQWLYKTSLNKYKKFHFLK